MGVIDVTIIVNTITPIWTVFLKQLQPAQKLLLNACSFLVWMHNKGKQVMLSAKINTRTDWFRGSFVSTAVKV